jgi:hypothetical protein
MTTEDEIIKSYWMKINKIEERISQLANRNINHSLETLKRKSLINKVNKLQKQSEVKE